MRKLIKGYIGLGGLILAGCETTNTQWTDIPAPKVDRVFSAKESPSQEKLKGAQAQVDAIVLDAAMEAYELINKNWQYPAPGASYDPNHPAFTVRFVEGEEGKAPHLIWTRGLNAAVKGEKMPSLMKDLQELLETNAQLECRMAQILVRVYCIGRVLEAMSKDRTLEEEFKELVNKVGLSGDIFETFSHYSTEDGNSSHSFEYIPNVDAYAAYKTGEARGHNVIRIGQDKYLGFGYLFKNGPISKQEIFESLQRAFLENYLVKPDFQEEWSEAAERYEESPLLFKMDFEKAQRDWVGKNGHINAAAIQGSVSRN